MVFLNPFWPKGGGAKVISLEKGITLFTQLSYLVSLKKEYPNFIREDPYELGQTPLRQTKVSKVKHFLEGSGHPKFMKPFEYGKSLSDKSFPKWIGTLSQPKP